MKFIINLIEVMIAVSVSALAAETNRTVDTELRDSAIVGDRLIWNNGFTRYLAVHQIYVCKVVQPPDSTNIVKRWQCQIDRTFRGERTGELLCQLPGETNQVKAGIRLIVLGNDHKTGFNVIGWWFHSKKSEKAIENLTQPTAAGYSRSARNSEP